MNKPLALILSITIVAASLTGVKAVVASADSQCQEFGFDFAIAKFEPQENAWIHTEGPLDGWSISLAGPRVQPTWTSTMHVSGVLSTEGPHTHVHPGGTEAMITVTPVDNGDGRMVRHEINHLTFCGNHHEVPEFGVVAFGLVGVLAAGLVVSRRK